jgi:hypothetical protein
VTDSIQRPLPDGIGIQVYRGAIKGSTVATRRAACARACAEFAAHGVTWVAWHGFSAEMGPNQFGPLAEIAKREGLASWASYGIDSDDMAAKGRRIGAVARMPECAGVIIDGEGKLEDEAAAVERAAARELRLALRAAAPDASVIVQWWELPQFHWSRYPYEELAQLADAIAPMEYLNNWRKVYGAARAAKMEPRWAEGRAKIQRRLLPLARPFFRTTHAAGWGDIPGDRLATLRAHADRLLVWAEPFPDGAFLRDIKRAVADRSAARKVPA